MPRVSQDGVTEIHYQYFKKDGEIGIYILIVLGVVKRDTSGIPISTSAFSGTAL